MASTRVFVPVVLLMASLALMSGATRSAAQEPGLQSIFDGWFDSGCVQVSNETGAGIFPLRKPGIFTLSDRSDIACSTAWRTWSDETSTVRRTRFSPRFSTAVGIGPFNQPGRR